MSTVTGVVQSVDERQTKIGLMYNIKVNGKSYGYGKYKPKCKAGDTVTFGVTYNGEYANVDTKNIQVTAGTGEAPQTSGAPEDKEKYWEKKSQADSSKQAIIERQAALNSAINFVSFLASNNALPPVAKAKDAEAVLTATLFHYRDLFLAESTGKGQPVKVEVQLPGEEPAQGGGWED